MTKRKVLSGKRNITVKMILALHKHLNIPTDTLLRVGKCSVEKA